MRKAYALRAVLTIKDPEALNAFSEILRDEGIEVVGKTANGADAVRILYECMPDFLICDIVLPRLDAYGLLKRIGEMRLETMPVMIVLSYPGMAEHEQRLLKNGAYKVFEKPVLAGEFKTALRMADVNARITPNGITAKLIREVLWSLGLNPRLAGTAYLTTAISLTSKDLRLSEALTTRLYPMIAERFETDGRGVERCMRRAIESAWSTGTLAAQHDLFGDSIDEQRGKPTCSELIVRVTDFLKLKEWKTDDKTNGDYRA